MLTILKAKLLERNKNNLSKIFVYSLQYPTFVLLETTKCFITKVGKKFEDNTPPRLVEIRHTWGVFSFYTTTTNSK
jgi:hypothetical protein